jgi:protein arginine kinase activator
VLCQLCKKSKAVIHSYCIHNNQLVETHFCEECGKTRRAEVEVCIDDSMSNLMEGLLKSTGGEGYGSAEKKCDICGTNSRDVKKAMKMGCPNCYELFSDQLMIEGYGHKSVYTKSEFIQGDTAQLHELRKELNDAVRLEDFERAARLRDRIRVFEKEGFLGDN